MNFWIWLLLIFYYGCGWFSILLLAFFGKKLRFSDKANDQLNAFTLACAGIWFAAMILAPTPKYFKSLQQGYQVGACTYSLCFCWQAFYHEKQNLSLKIGALALSSIEIPLFFLLPTSSFLGTLRLLYRTIQRPLYQWCISMIALSIGIVLLFVREKQGDWDIFVFWRRRSKRRFRLNIRLLLLCQIYVTIFATVFAIAHFREIIVILFFSLLLLSAIVGQILALLLALRGDLPVLYLLVPAWSFVVVFGPNRTISTPWAFIMLATLFLLWFVWSYAHYKNQEETTFEKDKKNMISPQFR